MSETDEVAIEIARRAEFERQRARERVGINAAAEAGVFAPGEPPELKMVREARAWQTEQWEIQNRPLDYAGIPTYSTDSAPQVGDTVAAAWEGTHLSVPLATSLTEPIDVDEIKDVPERPNASRATDVSVDEPAPAPVLEGGTVMENEVDE